MARFQLFFGRSGGTRTRGLQYPKLARYQLRYTSKLLFILDSLCHCARFSARPRWRSLLKHSRTAREDKPHSHYSLFLRIRYSLLLGHVRGLTVHRTVIQYPHAASLRQKQHSVVFVCSQLRYTSKIMLYYYSKAKTVCQDFLSIEKTTKILFIFLLKNICK